MLQICVSNSWQAVCDDFWDCNNAIVACKQLGYNGTGIILMMRLTYNVDLYIHQEIIRTVSFLHVFVNEIHSVSSTY